MPHLTYQSQAGALTLFEDDGALVAFDWGEVPESQSSALLEEAHRQLDAYFNGTLQQFDLPLRPQGTAFQKRLWTLLQQIPYGTIQTYGDLAKALGSAARAVGGACGKNPLPIIIPCHRVISATGKLTGYTGGDGIDTKRALLRLEGYRLK
ncbi:MAG: methylated-DNA--[protein]-cysteine S-methyltransferase [Rhodospirillaceae bacterium]|jgi:methylated-DNA-[protein]-cysteine S-methyltransferase|nr:methylated-DNA--[protein]-cysteine S-methyltransferase [Rhodospirillales bacterium]MBT3904684.1 methylated-DNA--[protein]-cysteine S-methyltransferase [Rhodospirillaceae bacterium]MBT4701390.1 methylated-DNA--[protein]-cysteine S-methyltransferase [Rhodospirillaceae bacterium]MBT5036218.1 methylated-DNA--[protein]-cysteine S-methyltransferase [Rhodospirillaceae bacterium]MBT6221648.1 methylated-DNA--[protein]-cysteine S-methyltransferase [Rhodospirillaceae bacterium]